jgi:hypothetical protein
MPPAVHCHFGLSALPLLDFGRARTSLDDLHNLGLVLLVASRLRTPSTTPTGVVRCLVGWGGCWYGVLDGALCYLSAPNLTTPIPPPPTALLHETGVGAAS